jgi:hypothetical protein
MNLNQPMKWADFRLDALLTKLYTTGPRYINNNECFIFGFLITMDIHITKHKITPSKISKNYLFIQSPTPLLLCKPPNPQPHPIELFFPCILLLLIIPPGSSSLFAPRFSHSYSFGSDFPLCASFPVSVFFIHLFFIPFLAGLSSLLLSFYYKFFFSFSSLSSDINHSPFICIFLYPIFTLFPLSLSSLATSLNFLSVFLCSTVKSIPRKLNRFRTGYGKCNNMLFHWNIRENLSCECGAEKETIQHIVEECPLTKFQQGFSKIHLLTEDALNWLQQIKNI